MAKLSASTETRSPRPLTPRATGGALMRFPESSRARSMECSSEPARGRGLPRPPLGLMTRTIVQGGLRGSRKRSARAAMSSRHRPRSPAAAFDCPAHLAAAPGDAMTPTILVNQKGRIRFPSRGRATDPRRPSDPLVVKMNPPTILPTEGRSESARASTSSFPVSAAPKPAGRAKSPRSTLLPRSPTMPVDEPTDPPAVASSKLGWLAPAARVFAPLLRRQTQCIR